MAKRKKSFLIAGSIVALVAAALSMLAGVLTICLASHFDERVVVEYFKSDPTYKYEQGNDGEHIFYYEDENGRILAIEQDSLEDAIDAMNTLIKVMGGFCIGLAVAKMVLAIIILRGAYLNKFKKGCTISLMILCAINGWIVEIVILMFALFTSETEFNRENLLADINEL